MTTLTSKVLIDEALTAFWEAVVRHYLNHWLKVLNDDKRAIFQAAAHAQRAVDFLHGLQPGGGQNQGHEPGEKP